MSEIQHKPENDSRNDHSKTERNREEIGNHYTGSEPFFAAYIQTQVYLNSVRLTLDEQVAVSVSDLASQLESARRTFIHSGDAVQALGEVGRIGSLFEQRVANWERQARSRETSKKTQSGEAIARMKAEHGRVRAKIQHTNRTFTKLKVELHQLAGGEYEGQMGVDVSRGPAVKDAVRINGNELLGPKPESTEQTRNMVRRLLQNLIGKRLPINLAAAQYPVAELPGGTELAIDKRLPLLVVIGWYHPDDFDRRKAKRIDARVWLVPKTPEVARALAAEVDQIDIGVCGHAIDLDRLYLRCVPVDNNGDELPRSDALVRFMAKIKAARFDASEVGFLVLNSRLNNLGPKQTELLLQYSQPPSTEA